MLDCDRSSPDIQRAMEGLLELGIGSWRRVVREAAHGVWRIGKHHPQTFQLRSSSIVLS